MIVTSEVFIFSAALLQSFYNQPESRILSPTAFTITVRLRQNEHSIYFIIFVLIYYGEKNGQFEMSRWFRYL